MHLHIAHWKHTTVLTLFPKEWQYSLYRQPVQENHHWYGLFSHLNFISVRAHRSHGGRVDTVLVYQGTGPSAAGTVSIFPASMALRSSQPYKNGSSKLCILVRMQLLSSSLCWLFMIFSAIDTFSSCPYFLNRSLMAVPLQKIHRR